MAIVDRQWLQSTTKEERARLRALILLCCARGRRGVHQEVSHRLLLRLKWLEGQAEAPMQHTMSILTVDGDVTHRWDPSKPDEVAHARSTFDLFRGKGYLAYRITGSGGQGEQVHSFNPEQSALILTPPLRGG